MTAARGWSGPAYEAVARLVGSRTGLVFAPHMRPTVEARIRAAMTERSIGRISDYLALLPSDEASFQALVDRLTIGETYFFREPGQFEYIRTRVLPELAGRSPGRPLRAWSAGCASGEEAYTLGMVFREADPGGSASVIGTDVSNERLEQARQGTYSRWSLRGVPESVVRRHFQREGSRYRVAPEVRSAVTFRPLNLTAIGDRVAAGLHGMDLVLCRNVLIYLSAEAVAQIADRLMASLSDDGWLFLGASDPPLVELVPCEVFVTGAGVAYRRPRRRLGGSPDQNRAPEVTRATARAALRHLPPSLPAAPSAPSPPTAQSAPSAPSVEEEVGDMDGAHAVVESYLAMRDYARAAELADRALRRGADDSRLWVLRVRALARQGRLDAAGRACSAALETHRTCAELMCLHAVLLSAAGHPAEAAAAARRALFLDRGMIMAHLVFGHALLRSGNQRKARRALETAERLLAPLSPGETIPASDGEPAARLLELVRRQLKLARDA